MRFRKSKMGALALAITVSAVAGAVPARADEAAAARQFRIARRLAAERSPQAAAALRKVVELAPEGPLADDALVEEANLLQIPDWPSDLGVLEEGVLKQALEILARVTAGYPGGDRVPEAQYRLALLRSEPVAGQDLAAARTDLLSVANDPSAGRWAARSRFASAAIDLRSGHRKRAVNALQRLLVDRPASAVGILARLKLAEAALQEGDYGAAAALAQAGEQTAVRLEPLGRSAPGSKARCAMLRKVAVESLLLEQSGEGAIVRKHSGFSLPGFRSVDGAAALPGGGIVLSDRKAGKVVRFDGIGAQEAEWEIPQAGKAAVDGFGQIWVAAGERLFRIRGREPRPILSLDLFASPRGLDAASTGVVWILDRKGNRVGRLEPGANRLETYWEGKTRLAAITWDGRRLLGLDGRNGRVLELRPGGESRQVAGGSFQKATALVSDHRGRFAVLDERGRAVLLYGARGESLGRLVLDGNGPGRPSSLVLYPDGGFGLPDPSSGRLHLFR